MSEASEALEGLRDYLAGLEEATQDFPAPVEFLWADFFFYNLATDVVEQSIAVTVLAETVVPRSAFANARAAWESAVDLAYLVSDRQQYIRRAIAGITFDVLKVDESARRMYDEWPSNPADYSDRLDPEAAIRKLAGMWEQVFPGRGPAMISAWERWTKYKTLPKHWSDLSITQLLEAMLPVMDDGGDPTDVREVLLVYSILSREAHPAARNGTRMLTKSGATFAFTSTERDNELPCVAASYACQIALAAVKRRKSWNDYVSPSAPMGTGKGTAP